MKKFLLISLSFLVEFSLLAKETNIQKLSQKQEEKVNAMANIIATIQDQSIKNYLYQVWINPMQEDIETQLLSNKPLGFHLDFHIYYVSGLTVAFKKIDEKIQEYKNEYDNLIYFGEHVNVNPYAPLMVNDENRCRDNYPINYISFYFNYPNDESTNYTIFNLHNYLQEYIDCIQVQKDIKDECKNTTEKEELEETTKIEQFVNNNKLWIYAPKELADLIIQLIIELEEVKYDWSYSWVDHFLNLWICNSNIWSGISRDLDLDDAFKQIETAVHSLFPRKYNNIIELLSVEFKQKGMSDSQSSKEAEKKLNDIIQIYANKLLEKAREK